jgi:hypothetical protein
MLGVMGMLLWVSLPIGSVVKRRLAARLGCSFWPRRRRWRLAAASRSVYSSMAVWQCHGMKRTHKANKGCGADRVSCGAVRAEQMSRMFAS